jgi:hypothetical protein
LFEVKMNKGCFIKTLMALSITSMGGYQAFVVVKVGGGGFVVVIVW